MHGPDKTKGGQGTLLDFTRVQTEWAEHAGEDLDSLESLLSSAPEDLQKDPFCVLLTGDLGWAKSIVSTRLYDWLGDSQRYFCLKPQFATAVREGLAQAAQLSRILTPSLITGQWEENIISPTAAAGQSNGQPLAKEKLAFISPLPPQRSGVSDYAIDLLSVLTDHFDIDIVVDPTLALCLPENVSRRLGFAEFAGTEESYPHVLYQIGNSPAHLPIMELLKVRPGVIVLHDFFLSHVLCTPEADIALGGTRLKRLYDSHGYGACLVMRGSERDENDRFIWDYPCNLDILQKASGVIVHNRESIALANRFYSRPPESPWTTIPHLKRPLPEGKRAQAREKLGIGQESFVVCTFGFLGQSKCSLEILQGFLASALAHKEDAQLVFVGSAGKDYRLQRAMQNSLDAARQSGNFKATVRVTGWTSTEDFQDYLLAADLAIQLRRDSRGETSGGVMSCLAAGVPLIVNSHGSMKELPDECVIKLPDLCDVSEIQFALEKTFANIDLRHRLAEQGREWLRNNNDPMHCAGLYAEFIREAANEERKRNAIAESIAALLVGKNSQDGKNDAPVQGSQEWNDAVETLALIHPQTPSNRQLFLDVSALAVENLGTGVQRVVLSICKHLLLCPPQGTRVEPVVACAEGIGYQYARKWTCELLGIGTGELNDERIVYSHGDIFLGLDLHHDGVCRQRPFFSLLRAQGVQVFFTIYDLLPCDLPHCFPEGTAERHHRWLEVVAQSDGAVCISADVANRLGRWMETYASYRSKDVFKISWFHLGSDFVQNNQKRHRQEELSLDRTTDPIVRFKREALGPILLMVGTIEPRKAYLDAIEAATLLWEKGVEFMLVVVGREGWVGLQNSERRTIPETIRRLRNHPEAGHRLQWFSDASDLVLEQLYEMADALVCTSLGEGFGLPLVEAASHNLPLLVRDLPVFSEISNGDIYTFPVDASKEELAQEMESFLSILTDEESAHKAQVSFQPISWQVSSQQLLLGLGLEPGSPLATENPIVESEASRPAPLSIRSGDARRRFALVAAGYRRAKALLKRGRNWLKRQRYRLRRGSETEHQKTPEIGTITSAGWEANNQALLRALARRSPT